MVTGDLFREFIYTIILIAGFCVAGFFVDTEKKIAQVPLAQVVIETPHPVRLIANPVVRIIVPEHNIFAK